MIGWSFEVISGCSGVKKGRNIGDIIKIVLFCRRHGEGGRKRKFIFAQELFFESAADCCLVACMFL